MKIKLNYRRTFFAGMAFFLICMFWQAYDTIIPLVLTYKFHMTQTLSGGIMAIDNILALFMLPLFGKLSDKCNTRLGRRTPFILVGTIIAVALFALLPFIDSLMYFVITLVAMLIAMAVFRSPAVALMPDITVKPLRSKANAVINLMGTIGGIIALLFGIVFATKEIEHMDEAYMHSNFYYYFISVASAMLISLVIYMLFVRENRFARDMQEQSRALGLDEEFTTYESGDEEAESAARAAGDRKLTKGELCSLIFLLASIFMWYTGYNAVTSKYSVYATHILHKDYAFTLMIANAAGLVSFLPVGIIASKRGRKKTILAGVIMMVVAFGCMSFVTADTPIRRHRLGFHQRQFLPDGGGALHRLEYRSLHRLLLHRIHGGAGSHPDFLGLADGHAGAESPLSLRCAVQRDCLLHHASRTSRGRLRVTSGADC